MRNDSPVDHVAFVSLHLEPESRGPTYSYVGVEWKGVSTDVLFEDCYINGYATNMVLQATSGAAHHNIVVRRCVIVDAYSTTSHSQGIYADRVEGLLIEECVFDRNGWNPDVPGAEQTIYNHSMYLTTDCRDITVRGNISSDASSHGLKFQPQGGSHTVADNLVVRCGIGLQLGGGAIEPENEGIEVTATGNVIIEGRSINGVPKAHGMNANNLVGGLFAGNIVAHKLEDSARYGFRIADPVGEAAGVGVQNLTFRDNIIYNWRAGSDGSDGAIRIRAPGAAQVYSNILIEDNIVQEPNAQPGAPLVKTYGLPQTVLEFSGNTYYSSNPSGTWFLVDDVSLSFSAWQSQAGDTGAQALQVQFVDPNRTTSTYAEILGLNGTHEAFIAEARLQSRTNWRQEFTAAAVITYIRAGFEQ